MPGEASRRYASALFDLLDRPWTAEAACRGMDPAIFYTGGGDRGTQPGDKKKRRVAHQVCDSCSVCAECLDYAIAAREVFGIWGNLSERQRRQMRRNRYLAQSNHEH